MPEVGLVQLARTALKVAQAVLPKHRIRFSKKQFTQPQLHALHWVMRFEDWTFLGAPAVWVLPVVFPVVMALGGALGVMGVPLPAAETGIALSGVILGLMVAFTARPPLWVSTLIVGDFVIFHGHAHGTELPQAANPVTYAVGFVIATGLLHLSGIALGLLVRWPWGKVVIR